MLWSLIFMRAQINNATATPNNRRGDLPKREAFRLLRAQALLAHHPKESVSLVDTRVELENGFSPSESMTSPNLSRYTFDMFGNAQKGAFSITPACRPYRDCGVASSSAPCASFASFSYSSFSIHFSIHVLRNKLSQLSRNQQHHQKLLDTLLICSGTQKGGLSRFERAK
jgi:hypothetical protein